MIQFNSYHNLLLPSLEAVGEFVRHNTSVRIMDNDSRSSKVLIFFTDNYYICRAGNQL